MAKFTHNTGSPTLARDSMPRHRTGEPWYPHGFGPESSDEALSETLRGAWGTPSWTLDIADEICGLVGIAPPQLDPACRPESEPFRRVIERGGRVLTGVPTCLRGKGADGSGVATLPDEGDGLAHRWSRLRKWTPGAAADAYHRAYAQVYGPGRPNIGSVWCNHPWARGCERWIDRAEEAVADGLWVFVLCPASTGTWWVKLWRCAAYQVCMRKICFDLCPGLGGCMVDAPPQQVSLMVLAPQALSGDHEKPLPLLPVWTNPVDRQEILSLTGPRWHAYQLLAQAQTEHQRSRDLDDLRDRMSDPEGMAAMGRR